MKLNEIINMHQHDSKQFSLSSFDMDTKKWLGMTEGGCEIFELYTHDKSNPYRLLGIFKMPEFKLRSSLIGKYDKGYFVIEDAYTPPEFKRQGFATTLYYTLVKHCGLKLMSDKGQTPEGRQFWTSLRKNRLGIKILNVDTGEIVSDDGTIPEDELYTNWPELNHYRLIYEETCLFNSIGSNQIVRPGMLFTHIDGKNE